MVINGELKQDEEISDLFALILGRMDTTAGTLDFGVALLAKCQDIQNNGKGI